MSTSHIHPNPHLYRLPLTLEDCRRGREPGPREIGPVVTATRTFEEVEEIGTVVQDGIEVHIIAIAAGYYCPELYVGVIATSTEMSFAVEHPENQASDSPEVQAMLDRFCEITAPKIIGDNLQRSKTVVYCFNSADFARRAVELAGQWKANLVGVIERYSQPLTIPMPEDGGENS